MPHPDVETRADVYVQTFVYKMAEVSGMKKEG